MLFFAPLTDRAFLIGPGELGDKLLIPVHWAPTLRAGAILQELTAKADVMTTEDLLVRCHGHPGGDVPGGGGSEVLDLGQKRRRIGAGKVWLPAVAVPLGYNAFGCSVSLSASHLSNRQGGG